MRLNNGTNHNAVSVILAIVVIVAIVVMMMGLAATLVIIHTLSDFATFATLRGFAVIGSAVSYFALFTTKLLTTFSSDNMTV